MSSFFAVADAVELHDVQPAVTMETSDAAPLSPPPPPPPSSAPSQEPSQPSVGDMDEEGGGNESATKEQRTVFISNLRFLTTEEQLREKLGEVCTCTHHTAHIPSMPHPPFVSMTS